MTTVSHTGTSFSDTGQIFKWLPSELHMAS